ncbi:hypothetical protein [Pseudomonas sp. 2822-17]|uniref:hypothetical protein n=1 Tax=Pseudomonas sp. 2822-17 TaxID=1712678 RepID=UPI000C150BA1|nr:hypothetical protein [Pseudomonas sp. 2822-17]PIB49804.1 hypothetical protein AOA60_27510 [Pseudomonas sp. 2822-17]
MDKPLKAYWVGFKDVYAAPDAEQAEALAALHYGPEWFTIRDIREATPDELEEKFKIDGKTTTIRVLLQGLNGPCVIVKF